MQNAAPRWTRMKCRKEESYQPHIINHLHLNLAVFICVDLWAVFRISFLRFCLLRESPCTPCLRGQSFPQSRTSHPHAYDRSNHHCRSRAVVARSGVESAADRRALGNQPRDGVGHLAAAPAARLAAQAARCLRVLQARAPLRRTGHPPRGSLAPTLPRLPQPGPAAVSDLQGTEATPALYGLGAGILFCRLTTPKPTGSAPWSTASPQSIASNSKATSSVQGAEPLGLVF
jgi:hypothetical protein